MIPPKTGAVDLREPMKSPLFPPLGEESASSLDALLGLIETTFPLAARFRRNLGEDTAELSRLLTRGRAERERAYLNRPDRLSAYLRYFLPWNVYRLCRLLPALPLDLHSGDALTDLGAGPLTLTIALWLSRPGLRSLELEFRCLDLSRPALEAGQRLFAALTGTSGDAQSPWRIRAIRGDLRTEVRGAPAALVSSLNLWNEILWDLSPADTWGLARLAESGARRLSGLCREGGQILLVEPGIPRAGEFIALVRDALLGLGRPPAAPCTHTGPCPMPGGGLGRTDRRKWCHFSFDTRGAPQALAELSMAAGIPKERGVLSFLLAGGRGTAQGEARGTGTAQRGRTGKERGALSTELVRIQSDPFPLPEGAWGRYACGKPGGESGRESGLVLLRGDRTTIGRCHSGALAEAVFSGEKDAKTGARMAFLGKGTHTALYKRRG